MKVHDRVDIAAPRTLVWDITTDIEALPDHTPTMTARHDLVETPTGTTNTLTVELAGQFAPILGALIRRSVRKALATENAAIKAVAERRSPDTIPSDRTASS